LAASTVLFLAGKTLMVVFTDEYFQGRLIDYITI